MKYSKVSIQVIATQCILDLGDENQVKIWFQFFEYLSI